MNSKSRDFKSCLSARSKKCIKHGRTNIVKACDYGLSEFVKVLLDNGADPNSNRSDNTTRYTHYTAFTNNKIKDYQELHNNDNSFIYIPNRCIEEYLLLIF